MADQKTPTPGELTIMASGGVALVFSFFHWVKGAPSVTTTIGGRTFTTGGGGGVSAWGKGLFPVATLIAILATIMAVQIALTKFTNAQLPMIPGFSWVQVHLALGFFTALLAISFLIQSKGYDTAIGYWVELIAGIAAFVGAIILSRERAGTGSA